MDRDADISALVENGLALADAAESAGLDAPVVCCPGWTVADLVRHTLEVHWFWGAVVAQRLTDPSGLTPLAPAADGDLIGQYREGVAILRAALETAPDDTPVWTWADRKDVGFVRRRMAQETAVHRWDAEHAAGRSWSIPVDLATDGIDEFLFHFLPDVADGAAPLDGTVHLHTTDEGGHGEWLVVIGDDGEPVVTREHAKGSCALRGTASDLLLALWRRHPLSAVDVVGDAGVAERFVARTNLD
jgi:uncharacterized protein (TIGR03083 family)